MSDTASKPINKGLFIFLYRKPDAEILVSDFEHTGQFSKISLDDYELPFNSTYPAAEFLCPADMLEHIEDQCQAANKHGLVAEDDSVMDMKWMNKSLVAPPRSLKPFDLLISAHRFPDEMRYAVLCLTDRMSGEDISQFKDALTADDRFSIFPGGFGNDFSAISLKHFEGDFISEIQEKLNEIGSDSR